MQSNKIKIDVPAQTELRRKLRRTCKATEGWTYGLPGLFDEPLHGRLGSRRQHTADDPRWLRPSPSTHIPGTPRYP